MKKLPIGRENLKDIIEGDFYYVDKTKIIEDLLDRGAYVTLFPRPRRFGKSLMISTIDEFFNIEKKDANKNLFDGLYVSKSKYCVEQGKFPVIKLNFKSLQSSNSDDMYGDIKEEIRQLFESKRYVLDVLNEEEKVLYYKLVSVKANFAEYKQSIKILSQFLSKYFNEKTILLIVEYYNIELTDEVKRMYDGYIFGNREIYNPWSILNYVSDKKLYPYWVNTSGDELLRDLFNKSKTNLSEMLEKLILGESIHCKYNEKVTFLDLDLVRENSAKDLVANFLLISGYLTKSNRDEISPDGYLELRIPNNEVRTVYTEVISNWCAS